MDSLRTETINGIVFIIHEVDPQETLFALSRRYNVDVDEIKRNNPIAAEGLRIGDIIRIPYNVQKKDLRSANVHVVKSGETLFSISKIYDLEVDDIRKINNLSGNELRIGQILNLPDSNSGYTGLQVKKTDPLPDTATYHWHVVRQGETLFALSRMYNHEVSELKRWNGLTGNTIAIGDSIIINYSPKAKPVQPKDENYTVTYTKPEDDLPVEKQPEKPQPENNESNEEPVAVASAHEDVKVTKQIITNDANYEEMVETGLAELIENSGDTRKYLALHRTAKIGTIIRVKNEMNDREVFVRVLGKLPDTGINDKVLIKISQAAFDRLNAIDKKFRVRISYFPD